MCNSWGSFASEKFLYRVFTLLALFDQPYEHTNPKSKQVLQTRPLLMENWDHPWRTTDLCPLEICVTQNEIKWWAFFKDIAENTENDLLRLTTSSTLLSSFSVKHPHETRHPTRGRRKEVLCQQTCRSHASASSSPLCRSSVSDSIAEIKFQALFQ